MRHRRPMPTLLLAIVVYRRSAVHPEQSDADVRPRGPPGPYSVMGLWLLFGQCQHSVTDCGRRHRRQCQRSILLPHATSQASANTRMAIICDTAGHGDCEQMHECTLPTTAGKFSCKCSNWTLRCDTAACANALMDCYATPQPSANALSCLPINYMRNCQPHTYERSRPWTMGHC